MKKTALTKVCMAVALIVILTVLAVFLVGRRQNRGGCAYDYTCRENGKKLTVSIERCKTEGYEWNASCSKEDFFEITSEPRKKTEQFVMIAEEGKEGACNLVFELKKAEEVAYQIRLEVMLDAKRVEVQSEAYTQPEAPISGGTEGTGISYDIFLNTDASITLQFYQNHSAEAAEDAGAEEKVLNYWSAEAPENVLVRGPVWNQAGYYFTIRNESSGFGLPGEQTVLFSNEAFDGRVSLVISEDESGLGLKLIRHEVLPAAAE